jgi:hypothetical protein
VSDDSGGLARFRLGAFVVDWLEPLVQAGREGLDDLLLTEAVAWLDLGQRIGYFAAAAVGTQRALPDDYGHLYDISWSPEVDLDVFEAGLTAAQEDLTDERRELLRLVLLASDEEWHHRTGQIRELAAGIRSSWSAARRAEHASRIAWCLEGTVKQEGWSSEEPLPAWWRTGGLPALGALSPIAARRASELQSALDGLSAVVPYLDSAADAPETLELAEARYEDELAAAAEGWAYDLGLEERLAEALPADEPMLAEEALPAEEAALAEEAPPAEEALPADDEPV